MGPENCHRHPYFGLTELLIDATGALHSRDVLPHQMKSIYQDIIASGDDFFEVQLIIDHNGTLGNYEYLVRWKGFGPDDDTWEPIEHFNDLTQIERYWQRRNQEEISNKNLKHVSLPRRSSRLNNKRRRT